MTDNQNECDGYGGTADFYIVKSIGMMMYLVRKGFDLIKIEDAHDNSKHKVFMFYRTPELEEKAKKYITITRKRNKLLKEKGAM